MANNDQFIPAEHWRKFIILFRNLEADSACGFDWFENVREYLEASLGYEYVRDLNAIFSAILSQIYQMRNILKDDIYYLDLQPRKVESGKLL